MILPFAKNTIFLAAPALGDTIRQFLGLMCSPLAGFPQEVSVRLPRIAFLALAAAVGFVSFPYAWSQSTVVRSHAVTKSPIARYGALPIAFEPNRGQSEREVDFVGVAAGHSLLLNATEADIIPTPPEGKGSQTLVTPIRIKLKGSRAQSHGSGEARLPGMSNYYLGQEPRNWRTGIPQFERVRFHDVYPGVDVVYHGYERQLESDFVVHPGASPYLIRMKVEGANDLYLDEGDIVLDCSSGKIHLRRPKVYQEVSGQHRVVGARYILSPENEISFELGPYDQTKPLIIDPVLAYSTFLNQMYGTLNNVAVDASGEAYVVGLTGRSSPPFTRIVTLSKLNADGTSALYTVNLGGSVDEWKPSVVVDAVGNAYVTGVTMSPDYPVKNAAQSTNNGCYDTFITKLKADTGVIMFSTFWGGSACEDTGGIAVDSGRRVYIAGATGSTDFPTVNALQSANAGESDAFVAKFSILGAPLYSTYLGGTSQEQVSGIATDLAANAYVLGQTISSDFPVLSSLQASNHGQSAIFLTKINPTGSGLVYSTYLGGSEGEIAGGLAVDERGNAYVSGSTMSKDFPVANAAQPQINGIWNAFVAKINGKGNALLLSTYLGGSGQDLAAAQGGIAVDSAHNIYVTGASGSSDFPTVNGFASSSSAGQDAFVTEIASNGSTFLFSTRLGGSDGEMGNGIAVDAAGAIYVSGATASRNFPITAGAFQFGGGFGFLTKIAAATFASTTPPRTNYVTQLVGTSSQSKNISMKNIGSGGLTIKSVYIAGTNPSDFTQTNSCPAILPPNHVCTVAVTFSPTGPGTRRGALVFSTSDPASPHTTAVVGTGTAIELSPSALAFDSQPVGSASPTQVVTLTNVASTTMKFVNQHITLIGANPFDFSLTNTCPATLAGGLSCQIFVTFTPKAPGLRQAIINVSNTDVGSPQKATISGTGT